MRVLLTGSSGFLGQNLLRYLTDSVMFSRVYLTSMPDFSCDKFHTLDIKGDLRDEEKVKKWLDFAEPDCVIHLAGKAVPGTKQELWQEMWDVNVNGTHNLLKHLDPHTRFVFASSINVQTVTTLYAASKLAAEQLVKVYAPNGVSLRFCAMVGPNLTHGALKDLIRKVKNDDEIVAWGNAPGSIKPYLHVSDAIQAIVLAATSDCNGPLDICTSGVISIDHMIQVIQAELKTNKKVVWNEQTTKGDIQYIKGDNLLARDILHWKPGFNSIEAIQDTIRDSNE